MQKTGYFGIAAIILFFSCISFLLLLSSKSPSWDEAVYLGMGKHIWSAGKYGLWEPARPVLLPIIVGFLWLLGFNNFLIYAFMVFIGAASIYVLFLIAKDIANSEKTAILFSFLFSINAFLVYFSSHIMVDIFAMLFSLLAMRLILRKKNFFVCGVLLGTAALAKFTYLLFIPVAVIAVLAGKKKTYNNIFLLAMGFIIAVTPFLVFNQVEHENPFAAFKAGNELIKKVVGNYYCPSSPSFYIQGIILQLPVILIFALASLAKLKSKHKWKLIAVIAAFSLPMIYHSFFLNCKDARYAFIFLPYLFILAAIGYDTLKSKDKLGLKILTALVILQIVISFFYVYHVFETNSETPIQLAAFYKYLNDKDITGEIWMSTPMPVLYKDVKADELIYYPVWDSAKIEALKERIIKKENVQYILISTCDIPCVRHDGNCTRNTKLFFNEIGKNFKVAFNDKFQNCSLYVYEPKNANESRKK